MDTILTLLNNPKFWLAVKVIAGCWIFSAATYALPEPPKSGGFWVGLYGFLFRFTHCVAANLDKAREKVGIPGASGPADPRA